MQIIMPTLNPAQAWQAGTEAQSLAGLASGLAVIDDQLHQGWTRTVNQGWCDDDLCILNDDCACSLGWLATLWDELEARVDAWFAGPSGACRTYPQAGGGPGDKRKPAYVSHLAGFCLVVKREAVRQLGRLDEAFIHYGSDVDYQWRAWRQFGKRSLWVPSVYVEHELHAPHQSWYRTDNITFNQRWR